MYRRTNQSISFAEPQSFQILRKEAQVKQIRHFNPCEKERGKTMKKRMMTLIAIFCVLSIAVGCSKNNPDNADGSSDYKWPVKNIEVIVPASAGGDTDFNARMIAKYFNQLTGISMVITNMTGGGGTIGASHVLESRNDGSIMFFGHTGQVIVTQVSGLADYTLDDFEITCIPAVEKSEILVVGKKVGVNTLKDLEQLSKKRRIIFASELGGYSNIQALLIKDKTGINLDIVDVGSASEKITNLLGGRVDVAVLTYGSAVDYFKTGELIPLGQVGEEPNPLISDITNIPTFKEAGYDFSMNRHFICAFPKGTNIEFVNKVAETIEEITQIPEYAEELKNTYKQPVTFYGRDESIKILNFVYDEFMQYQDLMR